jgi:8-oxo-dGTP pyrophosphatase MutT (NUDIX family)
VVLSAGVVVVRRENDSWRYLFLRAYKNWDFPKGVVEEGEDPFETAKREVEEETGIKKLDFRWGSIFRETEPYLGGKKIARYYMAETFEKKVTLPVSQELGRAEHDEYRWMSCEELKKRAPKRLGPIVEWANTIITGK